MTLRVFRAELAIYCCANYFESSWTHKCGKPAHLEVANHLFEMTTKEYNEITYLTVNIEGHQKIGLELRSILTTQETTQTNRRGLRT